MPQNYKSIKVPYVNAEPININTKHLVSIPNIYVLNARSLAKPNAVECLNADLVSYNIDCAFITETFLNVTHDIEIQDYAIFRLDRHKRKGGGVALFIRRCHPCSRIDVKSLIPFEICWVLLSMQATTYLCAVIYHPPNPVYKTSDLLQYLEEKILLLQNEYSPFITILAGDFNLINPGDIADYTGLCMVNKLPTRQDKILDNIYASTNIWSLCRPVISSVSSDHKAILLLATSQRSIQVASKRKTVRFFRPHGTVLIARFMRHLSQNRLDIDFDCDSPMNFDYNCEYFIYKLYSLLDVFFPARRITINSTDPYWCTAGIKSLLRRRNFLTRLGRIEESAALTETIRKMIFNNNATQFKNVNTRMSARKAWQKINTYIKRNADSSTINSNSTFTANKLNEFYANVSNDAHFKKPVNKSTVTNLESKTSNLCNVEEVYYLLSHLKQTATGQDALPFWFIKLSSVFISESVCKLFNYSIKWGIYPKCFKYAIINPIPKVKTPATCGDYRPISVTTILARIFDRIVAKKILYPLIITDTDCNFLSGQFAYMPAGSCENLLIALLQKLTNYLSRKENNFVAIISLDIAKAFDCISHSSVAQALANLNMPDEVYKWCLSYLAERQHCTYYDSYTSQFLDFNSGVIQGSGLGPLLFNIATKDYKVVSPDNFIIKYADDSYILIPEINFHCIETEISNFRDWASTKNLVVNTAKTKIMCCHMSKRHATCPYNDYLNKNVDLLVNDMKILGVNLNSKLSFADHVTSIVNKCNKLFYLIRILRMKNLCLQSCRDLFISLVVSQVTYCAMAWNGFCSQQDIARLRKIFKRGYKLNYLTSADSDFDSILQQRSDALFQKILQNQYHPLHPYLTPVKNSEHDLRLKKHNRSLPTMKYPFDTRNYLINMLYK